MALHSFLKAVWAATTRSGPEFDQGASREVTPSLERQALWMRTVLFYVVMLLFVIFFVGTTFMIFADIGSPSQGERDLLVKVFIVEVGAAVIGLFYFVFGMRRIPPAQGEPVPGTTAMAKGAPPVPLQSHRLPSGATDYEKGPALEESSVETLWSRSMPRLNLEPKETVAELHRVLERIRQRACDRVRKFGKRTTLDEFRVHVFLPDYSRYQEHGAYELFLPEDLRLGVGGTQDAMLRLLPEQGVAGRVFARGVLEKVVISADEDGTPIWPAEYESTEAYKRWMPKEIRWLVAIPLRVPCGDKDMETIGVLGIQGLKHSLESDQLDAVAAYLLADITLVATFVGRLSRVRLTITQEELANDR